MDFFCRVLPEGLVPLDDADWNEKRKLGIGKDVKVHITIPRNLKFHRKFMALLTIVYDNLPEKFSNPHDPNNYIGNLSSLLAAIKKDLGYCDIFRVNGEWKSHTNLTHPGKYFRPSKVKIMRPTSPK